MHLMKRCNLKLQSDFSILLTLFKLIASQYFVCRLSRRLRHTRDKYGCYQVVNVYSISVYLHDVRVQRLILYQISERALGLCPLLGMPGAGCDSGQHTPHRLRWECCVSRFQRPQLVLLHPQYRAVVYVHHLHTPYNL